MIEEPHRPVLLALARHAVEARARGEHDLLDDLARGIVPRRLRSLPADVVVDLAELTPSGLFVSLHTRDGRLRGCIGYTSGDRPLIETLVRAASSATADDPRFPPVSPSEVSGLDIEISVLTPFERIDDLGVDDAVVVGRHGLFIEHGQHRGLLLPQVATEWGWSREVFLHQVCLKAGLTPEALRLGAALYRFEAVVFGEAGG